MEIWIDAQLSPSLALWINELNIGVTAHSIRALGLREADDVTIFQKAKLQGAVIMSKDADFIRLLEKFGPPPQIIWITTGNTSNLYIREVLKKHFKTMLEMLGNGEPLIEIQGA